MCHMRDTALPPRKYSPKPLQVKAGAGAAVELAVKDLLPRAKIQVTVGDCHDDLPAHHLAIQVGVACSACLAASSSNHSSHHAIDAITLHTGERIVFCSLRFS